MILFICSTPNNAEDNSTGKHPDRAGQPKNRHLHSSTQGKIYHGNENRRPANKSSACGFRRQEPRHRSQSKPRSWLVNYIAAVICNILGTLP